MFTGIIEDVGTVQALQKASDHMAITVLSPKICSDVQLGDSVAVNGVCLTVTHFTTEIVTMDVMPETVKATNLTDLTVGDVVNLERAMAASGRFGGHFVSGHVDGIGTILRKRSQANAIYVDIAVPEVLAAQCITKGSITVDGTSLTLFDVQRQQVTISLIPHTAQETVLGRKKSGGIVNIETDLIGKYVRQQLQQQQSPSAITKDYLAKNGF